MKKKLQYYGSLKTCYRILGPLIKTAGNWQGSDTVKKRKNHRNKKNHKLSYLKIYASHKEILYSRVQTTRQIFHISTFMKLRHELQI